MAKKQIMEENYNKRKLLSTGSTWLNLACSDKRNGGIAEGSLVFMPGASDSGKTMLAMTILAEAANNPAFDEYELKYSGPENGMRFNLRKMFGNKLADRLIEDNPETIEAFYDDVDDQIKSGKPFIRILDSMDSIESEDDNENFEKKKEARRSAGKKKAAGTYGTGKPKANSRNLRRVAARIDKTGSILIIIGQLRQNFSFGAALNPQIFTGGMALKYYSHLMLWVNSKGSIKTRAVGKDREIGIQAVVKVKKNRQTGKKRTSAFPIYYDVGIDDLGSCVQFLIEEGYWKGSVKPGGKVQAPEFKFKGFKEDLIAKIEKAGTELKLRKLVSEHWKKIEKACKVERKSKYT